MPKPLVEFANKPMIMHQIEALAAVGVTDVVLAVNYRPEIMESVLKEVSSPALQPQICSETKLTLHVPSNSTKRSLVSRSTSHLSPSPSARLVL